MTQEKDSRGGDVPGTVPAVPPSWLPERPRILIVKLSAVGDVVHTLPALNRLRQAYPGATIGWAVHPGAFNLLQGHPDIDELLLIPRRLGGLSGMRAMAAAIGSLRGPRGRRWHCVIDFQGLTKSGLAAWLSFAPRRIGFAGEDSRELNSLFINERVCPSEQNVIRKNLELLRPLGIAPGEAIAHFPCREEDRNVIFEWADRIGVLGERFVVIDPFAGWPSKLWPGNYWVELAWLVNHALNSRVMIFYGPGEREHADRLAWDMRARGCRCVLAPETTLRQYVALLLEHAGSMVGGDTGPMHIAAALGVPTVAMFGPSSAQRNAPAFSNAHYVALHDDSQPCAGSFVRRCPYHAPGGCMSGIEPRAVLDALKQLL